MLVKELAETLGQHGIRVNALVPGAIAAGGFVADPALARHVPLGRLGQSDDLVPMALTVLSNRLCRLRHGRCVRRRRGLGSDQLVRSPRPRRRLRRWRRSP